MTDAPHDLEKLKIEAEVKKEGYRQGVKKVIYGTMIVGVAAALFPFMQKVSESFFAAHIEEIRRQSEIDILTEKNRLEIDLANKKDQLDRSKIEFEQTFKRKSAYKEFLQSLASEARSEDLSKRIVLAEFYSFLADEEERNGWEEFRDHLYKVQEKYSKEREELLTKLSDPNANQIELSSARARLDRIDRLESPIVAEASASVLANRELLGPAIADEERKRKALGEAESDLVAARTARDEAMVSLDAASAMRDAVRSDPTASERQKQQADLEVAFRQRDFDRALRGVAAAASLRDMRQRAFEDALRAREEIEARTVRITAQYGLDLTSDRIEEWLNKSPDNRQILRDWLTVNGQDISPTFFVFGSFSELRNRAILELGIP